MTTSDRVLTWPTIARDVDDLVAVLNASADHQEPAHDPARAVTQLAHGLQCAALLQTTHPDDLELQVAGLLHDVGHTLAPGEVEAHGRVGCDWLAPRLGERVGALVELHVAAKRYLVTVDPTYRERLSAGSTRTLAAQGDALSPAEIAAFRRHLHHRDALTLRRADERAKVAGIDAGRVADWIPALRSVASARSR